MWIVPAQQQLRQRAVMLKFPFQQRRTHPVRGPGTQHLRLVRRSFATQERRDPDRAFVLRDRESGRRNLALEWSPRLLSLAESQPCVGFRTESMAIAAQSLWPRTLKRALNHRIDP